jgi:Fe-S-cluster containining protein
MMDTPVSLCELCARNGKTCCQGRDIYVTPGDVRRISLQVDAHDFYEFRRSLDPAYEDQSDDPLWFHFVFRTDKTRRVLKRDVAGNCVFLTARGCSLALPTRPLVCRLHPHNYTARGVDPGPSEECPVHLLAAGQRIEEAIAGFDPGAASHWHRLLYDEILGEDPSNENRTHL